MEKALTDGWKAFLAGGIASMVGAASLSVVSPHPRETEVFSWFLLSFGMILTLLAIYGIAALIFPSIAPPPQMLQDRLLWTAKRYRNFAAKHEQEHGQGFSSKFWKKYPYSQIDYLAKRADNVVRRSNVTINWQLLTERPANSNVVLQIANHLELIAQGVPPNVPT